MRFSYLLRIRFLPWGIFYRSSLWLEMFFLSKTFVILLHVHLSFTVWSRVQEFKSRLKVSLQRPGKLTGVISGFMCHKLSIVHFCYHIGFMTIQINHFMQGVITVRLCDCNYLSNRGFFTWIICGKKGVLKRKLWK